MNKYNELKEKIFSEIDKYKEELVELNDDIADHPETSGKEYETSKKIVNLLKSKGYETEYPFAGFETAFRGIYGSNNHKYKIAILTEYDALPEIGHACGHCLSGSISILAGFATKDIQDELNADIHIIGTPIEETDGAKCAMADDGIFDEYDMAMMVHLYDQNLVAPKLLALASYMYNFHGKAAHAAAAPWAGVNAFNAGQLMFHAMDMLRQHSTPDVRMHGIFRKAGDAPGIVPDEVSAEVYIRAENLEYLNGLIDRVDDCARGGAIATQCTWDKYQQDALYHNLKSNPSGEACLKEVFEDIGLPLNGDPDKLFGSSDAGNVSSVCPTFHATLQVVDRGVAIHTREFAAAMKTERAHNALADGAKLIGLQIAKVFSDENRIKAMKADFERK